MLLTIAARGPQADALGYLLHKHPDRVRTVSLPFGTAHVFYPAVEPELVQAALLVEVDPVYLSRRKGAPKATLEPYVNDRPYTASSLLSVAMNKLFGTALAGNCEARPELVAQPLRLELCVPVVHTEPAAAVRAFEPLGWEVECAPIAPTSDGYVALTLRGTQTVAQALAHLYVLLPALDGQKHYWVDEAETDKLLRRGEGWLDTHPDREWIVRRYLKFASLASDALDRLSDNDSTEGSPPATDADSDTSRRGDNAEHVVERPLRLNEARIEAVMDAVEASGATTAVDLGCGEGRLLERLIEQQALTRIVGLDVSMGSLRRAEARLKLDDMSERRRERIELMQGALTYRDDRLARFDVALLIEVIEHVDPERLDALEEAIFGHARPNTVIVTTPNVEYNVNFPGLPAGTMRHTDHRFEWTRDEFTAWIDGVCERSGYSSVQSSIGVDDPATGAPTQMVVFTR